MEDGDSVRSHTGPDHMGPQAVMRTVFVLIEKKPEEGVSRRA